MAILKLRYDMRMDGDDPAARADLYAAALDQIEWADRLGFDSVMLHEHHGAPDGYLPSPIVMAGAVAARTSAISIVVGALLVPLHDPIRLAEDLAVVDILSRGRLVVTPGVGYVPEEFEMFGRAMSQRGKALDRGLEVLGRAWSGESFEYEGRRVRVTPRPHQRPRPPLVVGGGSRPAARRAARVGDGFAPHLPDAWTDYREELTALGLPDPGPMPPSGPRFLHVSDDPDRSWSELAPYLLHEMNSYARFAAGAGEYTGYVPTAGLAELQGSPHYRVVTPQECVALVEELGPGGVLCFRPLAGGMPPALGWASLRLFADEVLPHITVEREPAVPVREAANGPRTSREEVRQ
ncbi:LLM class flavin-dependent oxidoreductase [Actinomadura bangladeshensis]|uniref:LLM class flavin-dependent oxidoreductase n=1 Tax=Actinomadura bangladeshensis TaxID=453573 RepID=A0A4R4PDQ4_9ACTN|nr:LLM class flavin-dependent oxidoreductase [Actinomadura bangladeshensis]TDC20334.1 LLM class flavin-dependent oxidoreductase [Actinomadura bangladeshensis]